MSLLLALLLAADPYVVVLGTAQDGGRPQLGCELACCTGGERRLVASLLIVDPRSDKRWLIDATPDIREQMAMVPPRESGEGRPPPFDGIFLTHAHMGHYTGLAQLGREAYAAEGQKVYASPSMCEFLSSNGPWDLMVREKHIELISTAHSQTVELADDLRITPITVPHRQEYSDAVAYIVEGPNKKLFYCPDIDKWDRWDVPIDGVIPGVEIALVDGSFYDDGEVPGRDMADIPHPFIVETIERLSAMPADQRAKVFFTHLNHTNPAGNEGSEAAKAVEEAGMALARRGQILGL